MDDVCDDIDTEECQGWIYPARRFFPRCLARESIAEDVDPLVD